MKVITKWKSSINLLLAVTLAGGLTACVDDSDLNNDTVEYTPEYRPLGVIAGEDAEYEPGSTVVLNGRLTGTVEDESLLWKQIGGTPIEEITDWTQAQISFTAPDVEGIESYTFELAALDSAGNVIEGDDGELMVDDVNITVFDPARVMVFEVEDDSVSTLSGDVSIAASGDDHYLPGYSGTGHTTDMLPGSSATFNIDFSAELAGYYSLYITYAIPLDYGGKIAKVTVNGLPNDLSFSATGAWEEMRVGTFNLEAGTNVIEVCCGWNYYRIDNIKLLPAAAPATPLPVVPTLVNPDASEQALELITFLTDNYASKTLSGQTEFNNYGNAAETGLREYNKVVAATGGDAPAIVAYDYMDYSSSRVANGAVPGTLSEDMIAAKAAHNVILSALWHWNAPSSITGDWWGGFYTENTDFDLAAAMADTSSDEYQELLDDMDSIAAELKKMQDAGVPILWRPLHEAEGGWFWWGAAGSDAYKALWQLMYTRFTEEHGLNNLIWVFTHTDGLSTDWYPGDEFVDIVGFDGYDDNNHLNPFSAQYSQLKDRHNGKKLVALTETGAIPDVSVMHENNAWWSFFITWNSSDQYGPDAMAPEVIAANYAYENLINQDDLPGGTVKVGPGNIYNFDRVEGFEAQVSWSPTSGITTSSGWSKDGLSALSITKDLSAETDPSNVVMQVYPEGGIDVTDVSNFMINVTAMGAGADTTAYLFVKHGADWVWASTDALSANGTDVELSIDVSEYEVLAGFGVVFESFDSASTAAEFYLDSVWSDDDLLYDFEGTKGWEGQVSWSPSQGLAISKEWSASNQQSLVMMKDLSAETEPSNIVIQTYPEGGIDVSDVAEMTISARSMDAGTATTAYLFVKHGADWVWASTSALSSDTADAVLSIDVSEYDVLAGYGLVFEGFDTASTNARFFMDSASLDGSIIADFEQTEGWEAQVSWAPTTELTISEDWAADGGKSLSITKDLSAESEPSNVVLQAYPEMNVEGVTSLTLKAYSENAGADTTAYLFIKEGDDWVWHSTDAVAVNGTEVTLTIDCSAYDFIAGFGVVFEGFDASATDARFYVDSVEFE